MMKIAIICSDLNHPVMPHLLKWQQKWHGRHDVQIASRIETVDQADITYLVSCSQIITADARLRLGAVMVLHASDLPKGRGWSPHVWDIIGGAETLTLSLIEAVDPVDSGGIWVQDRIPVPRDALYDEINALLFEAELKLMDMGLGLLASGALPRAQPVIESTWHPKRKPEDSELDPTESIEAQFDLIRVCDPDRYPAFFTLRGQRYAIELRKLPNAV